MKRIFKYPLPVDDEVVIPMPSGARILTVQAQNNLPCVWAVVTPDAEGMEDRRFRVFGTGHPIPEGTDSLEYIGTFQLHNGRLVFHLFERVG